MFQLNKNSWQNSFKMFPSRSFLRNFTKSFLSPSLLPEPYVGVNSEASAFPFELLFYPFRTHAQCSSSTTVVEIFAVDKLTLKSTVHQSEKNLPANRNAKHSIVTRNENCLQ